MPVRLHCGSASTITTECPRSASIQPRLKQVVVLLTPPLLLKKLMVLVTGTCLAPAPELAGLRGRVLLLAERGYQPGASLKAAAGCHESVSIEQGGSASWSVCCSL